MPVARALVYRQQGGFDESVRPESIGDLLPAADNVLWLDLRDPTDGDLELLRREFGFHELALEDTRVRHQRAKIEQYDGYSFLVFYAVSGPAVHEISLFVGENYLVTVHVGEVPEITETAARWRQNAGRMAHGVATLVYSLLDAVVDAYFPAVDGLAERLEAVEQDIFQTRRDCLPDVFRLKRDLLNLRRVLSPERDVLNVLIRRDNPVFGPDALVYFQDIYDHILRVLDSIDLYRDQLSGMLDAYLSVVANRLNTVMKRMTALATILMSMALITGIYGMNFHVLPELDWPLGYYYALGLMAVIGLVLAAIFRHLDWL